jgi:hypothetical protein
VLRGGRYIHDELMAAPLALAVAVASNGRALSGMRAQRTHVEPITAEALERITAEAEDAAAS